MDNIKFSERMGITLPKAIQINDMDDALRNRLWNVIKKYIVDDIRNYYDVFDHFLNTVILDYFGKNIDRLPKASDDVWYEGPSSAELYIEKSFFSCEWYEVYNFIEFVFEYLYDRNTRNIKSIILLLNNALKSGVSGYRLVESKFVPITNETELQEIEQSLEYGNKYTALKGCNNHLEKALTFLSDRQNPDYPNSIKESICAVESIAKIISGKPNDTLGAALDKIKGKLRIHASLEKGFKNIYGYTSDEGGIRHSMADNPNCDFEDAKFMLVACSAFVNYLTLKADKAGIDLNK